MSSLKLDFAGPLTSAGLDVHGTASMLAKLLPFDIPALPGRVLRRTWRTTAQRSATASCAEAC